MPRKVNNVESTTHPDGIREGVMNDSAGVQYGVRINPDVNINPAHITKVKKQGIKNQGDRKERS